MIYGTKIYRTDESGEIKIETNGIKMKEPVVFLP